MTTIIYKSNRHCYFGWFGDFLIDLADLSRVEGPYMYKLLYAYAYALSDMRRIILILMQAMHILIQAAIFMRAIKRSRDSRCRYTCNRYILRFRHLPSSLHVQFPPYCNRLVVTRELDGGLLPRLCPNFEVQSADNVASTGRTV